MRRGAAEIGEERSIDEIVYLHRFPQPFGGYRWYFICPSSNRGCTVLYQPPSAPVHSRLFALVHLCSAKIGEREPYYESVDHRKRLEEHLCSRSLQFGSN